MYNFLGVKGGHGHSHPLRVFFFEQYQGLEDPRGDYIRTRGGYKFTKRPFTTLALMNLLFEDKACFLQKTPCKRMRKCN
jgi:hypothetical protein